VTEAEVAAEFLRAALASDRWSDRIRGLLEDDEALVTSPRLDDERENRVRAELLERHRSPPNRGVGALPS